MPLNSSSVLVRFRYDPNKNKRKHKRRSKSSRSSRSSKRSKAGSEDKRKAKEAAAQAKRVENLKVMRELAAWYKEARDELKTPACETAEIEGDKLVPDWAITTQSSAKVEVPTGRAAALDIRKTSGFSISRASGKEEGLIEGREAYLNLDYFKRAITEAHSKVSTIFSSLPPSMLRLRSKLPNFQFKALKGVRLKWQSQWVC
ncbi:hypothetical protein Salat_0746700 [Sesamum alatum]|uniref:Uncharacterized protein n=1 Tax=Sesamum alatum TaxID=300844 RepID=A0AAE2CV78_9LAMI|nr:hypothetical protein Salat_0746700 [Sesamum alatum]